MKKIITYVIILCFLLSLAAPLKGFAQTAADKRYDEALFLLNQLCDYDFGSNKESFVKRGDFIDLLFKTLNLEITSSQEQIFSDVSVDDINFGSINSAYNAGWISKAEVFNPTKPITVAEAVKILMCVCSYGDFAEKSGGYPEGYIQLATRFDFMEGVSVVSEHPVSSRDIVVLLYNLLTADAIEFESISKKPDNIASVSYKKTGKKYLELLMDTKKVEGIISETAYSSILTDADINHGEAICIDGIRYESPIFGEKYLGLNVEAYYKTDDNGNEQIVAVVPVRNNEETVALKAFESISSEAIYYSENNKTVKHLLSPTVRYIYNGRRIDTPESSLFTDEAGNIRFLDNNNDNKADIVFINKYNYYLVENVDYAGNSMGLRKYGAFVIDEDNYFTCYNAHGEKRELSDIQSGDVLAIKVSSDGLVKTAILCEDEITGILNMIDTENGIVEINNTSYRVSKKFISEYLTGNVLGKEITVAVGIQGDLAMKKEVSWDFIYGILLKTDPGKGLGKNPQIKIFTERGKFEIFDFADKVSIDGGKSIKKTEVIGALANKSFSYGLIRYKLNDDKKITNIDLPADWSSTLITNESDSLVKYIGNQSMTYRESPGTFIGTANITSAVMFATPNVYSENEDDYFLVNISDLKSGSSYNGSVYDIDNYGYSGAVVLKNETALKAISVESRAIMVDKVVNALNAEGEWVHRIDCWNAGVKQSYFTEDDTNLTKTSGKLITKGDIVRLKLRDSIVTQIVVDIDAEGTMPVVDASSTAVVNEPTKSFYYAIGYPYSAHGYMLNVVSEKINPEKIFPKNSKINPIGLYSTTSFVKYNRTSGEITPIEISDIHSILGYGNTNQCVVVKVESYIGYDVFVYED